MANTTPILAIDSQDTGLKKIATGKVREVFEIDAKRLLFVATDRISAFDVVLQNGIPSKGAILTQLSKHWFSLIKSHFPDLRTQVISTSANLTSTATGDTVELAKRSMEVLRTKVIPIESIVRGYITGSAWSEYKKSGTVHGMPMPPGLQEGQRLEKPIWTPSTKAEQGEHDENISRDHAAQLIGEDVANTVEEISLKIYKMARDYIEDRGIIIADTKFEFGIDTDTNEVVLIDEVLTPDSSRFWSKDEYHVGKSQISYDKQYLRDWLTTSGLKGVQGVSMPDEVVERTASKYREAYEKITGEKWV